jgi:hypothetical protein
MQLRDRLRARSGHSCDWTMRRFSAYVSPRARRLRAISPVLTWEPPADWQRRRQRLPASTGPRTRHRGVRRRMLDGFGPIPEFLLATKLLASRVGRDEDDILLLYRICGLTTADQGFDPIERYYPGRPIQAKVRSYLEELLTSHREPRNQRPTAN